MQSKQIKLKEVIWEITGECNNGCEHCGSKENRLCKTPTSTIKTILSRLAEFPPEQLNISGGDPLLVDYSIHKQIVNTLKPLGVVCKIIVNPLSVALPSDSRKLKILSLYDYIGVSINSVTEKRCYFESIGKHSDILKKVTIITNFNLSNIFAYDEIEKLVKDNNFIWQIQFTMFKGKHPQAIYENIDSLRHLQKMVDDSVSKGIRIVLADNMNEGQCSAGLFSCGILSNGDVVPCLSMRSWVDRIGDIVQGSLQTDSLENIWTRQFKKYRFDCFKCCKDHCGNKKIQIKASYPTIRIEPDGTGGVLIEDIKKKFPEQQVLLYGVSPNIVTVYGVSTGTGTMAYGVSPNSVMVYGVVSTVTDPTSWIISDDSTYDVKAKKK